MKRFCHLSAYQAHTSTQRQAVTAFMLSDTSDGRAKSRKQKRTVDWNSEELSLRSRKLPEALDANHSNVSHQSSQQSNSGITYIVGTNKATE